MEYKNGHYLIERTRKNKVYTMDEVINKIRNKKDITPHAFIVVIKENDENVRLVITEYGEYVYFGNELAKEFGEVSIYELTKSGNLNTTHYFAR